MSMLESPLPINSVSTGIIDKKKNKQKSNYNHNNNETTQHTLTSMGLISSFSITTSTSTPLLSTTTKKNSDNTTTATTFNKPIDPLHNGSISDHANNTRRKPSELKFKIESIGVQPEEDDDLDTCPARTRAIWPQQLMPWWQPSHPKDRPPYPYSTLIAYAILVSQDGRLLLSDIYKWISDTYPYYNLNNRGWQNSIRHNLSLYKRWFLKVDRRPTQANPGKGCYWTLVPGTEQMFMDNITEAGGHSRKHHDIGLTKELSMGHHNHLLMNHPIMSTNSASRHHSITSSSLSSSSSSSPSSSSSSSPTVNKSNSNNSISTVGGINPTFSHTNMKILLPEDYQQQENAKKNSTTSSSNNNSVDNNDSDGDNKTETILKSSKKKPTLNPTFGSFRITNNNNTNANETTKRSFDKVMTNQDIDDQVTKRMKLGDIDVSIDNNDIDIDDSNSDCDSGIDVDNRHLQRYRKNSKGNKLITSDGLVLDKEEIELYNVLDTFLEQLPIPPTTNTVTLFNPSSSTEKVGDLNYPSTTMIPFNMVETMNDISKNNDTMLPVHPLDNDPVLGYPAWQYYSTDGFFFDTMETNDNNSNNNNSSNDNNILSMASNDQDYTSSTSTTYPNLLTSSFEPDLSSMMLDMNDPFEKLNGPIIIHLNGNQQQQQQQQQQHLSMVATMPNEEMTDEFLKFEEDDFLTSQLNHCEIENDTLDPSLLLNDSGNTSNDPFILNMSTMCGLMEA